MNTATPRRPRLADGVELIGEHEGSGYSEPFFLVRRVDGQVIQLSRLLYLIASSLDGSSDIDEIAARATRETGRAVSAANVDYLVEHKLRRLGVAAGAQSAPPPRAAPLLGLTIRRALLPAWLVSSATGILMALFTPVVVVAVLACVAVFDAWLFVGHGVRSAFGEALSQPSLMLAVLALTACSALFHEFGHAAGCRYGGARPGAIGAGIYLVWPVFYSDVTDCYRLSRAGRLRTDVGGLYFNAIFVVAIAITYFLTGFEWLLVVIVAQHLVVLQQCLPVVRLDGYYIVSDLAGVPDLFGYIKPIMLSMIPGRPTNPAVKRLKPRVRVVVAGWVALCVLMVSTTLVLLVSRAPELVPTAKDSLNVHAEVLATALRAGQPLVIAAAVVEIALLVVAIAGIAALSLRIIVKAGRSGLALVERRRQRDRGFEHEQHDNRPGPHGPATPEQSPDVPSASSRGASIAGAARDGPYRVILGPPEHTRGLRVTGVEFYDEAILVRWQVVLPAAAHRAQARQHEQITPALVQQLPAFALHDERGRAYQPLRRCLPSIAAIADSGKTTARGTQLFAPAPPADIRVLRLEADGRQFVIAVG